MDWRPHIIADPNIMHGVACLRGTRIAVSVVLDNLAANETPARILEQYPSLKPEHIPAAIAYAADLARERIVPPISNRGEAVADLAPSEGAAPKDKPAAVEEFKAFLQEHPVQGVADVAALIDKGRA